MKFELGLAAAMGAAAVVLMFVAAPVPQDRDDCRVYKVAPKAVTSYVLKPPPAPPTETKQCPVYQVPKCEPAVEEKPAQAEKVSDKPRHRRYRHHRVRSYWR